MKNTTPFFLFFLLSIVLTSCPMDIERPHNVITFKCDAPHSIGCLILMPDNYTRELPENADRLVLIDINVCQTGTKDIGIAKWSKYVTIFPNDTVSFVIFHADTLERYSWNQIRQENKFLVRYDIAAEDYYYLPGTAFGQMTMTVPYPPTSSMASIRMCPPYEKVMEQYEEDCRKIAEREGN